MVAKVLRLCVCACVHASTRPWQYCTHTLTGMQRASFSSNYLKSLLQRLSIVASGLSNITYCTNCPKFPLPILFCSFCFWSVRNCLYLLKVVHKVGNYRFAEVSQPNFRKFLFSMMFGIVTQSIQIGSIRKIIIYTLYFHSYVDRSWMLTWSTLKLRCLKYWSTIGI